MALLISHLNWRMDHLELCKDSLLRDVRPQLLPPSMQLLNLNPGVCFKTTGLLTHTVFSNDPTEIRRHTEDSWEKIFIGNHHTKVVDKSSFTPLWFTRSVTVLKTTVKR